MYSCGARNANIDNVQKHYPLQVRDPLTKAKYILILILYQQ